MSGTPETLPPWLVTRQLHYEAKSYKTYEYIPNKGYYRLRYRGSPVTLHITSTIFNKALNSDAFPFFIPTPSNMVSSETRTVWRFETEQEAYDFVACMLQLEM